METVSSMPPSADNCGQGSTLGERGTTVFYVKPPATGRLLDALVPTSLQDRTTRPAPSRTEPPRASRGASTAVTIHTPSPCPVVRRNRRLSRAHQHRRGIYGRTP